MESKRYGWLAIAVVLVVALTGCVQVRYATDEARDLREFASRVLGTVVEGPSGVDYARAELLPGRIAMELPVRLDLAPTTEVAGSVVRRTEAGVVSIEVLLDTDKPPESALDSSVRSLTAAGFELQQQGFQPSGRRTLCDAGGMRWMTVSARPREAGAEVRLVYTASGGPCLPAPGQAGAEPLPGLASPRGLEVRHSGGGSGPGRVYSEAMLRPAASLDVVEAHYRAQLEAAGWELLEAGGGEVFRWSAWQPPDPGWYGVFWLSSAPAGHVTLHLRVEADPANQPPASIPWQGPGGPGKE